MGFASEGLFVIIYRFCFLLGRRVMSAEMVASTFAPRAPARLLTEQRMKVNPTMDTPHTGAGKVLAQLGFCKNMSMTAHELCMKEPG